MVDDQIRARNIRAESVLSAMRTVPRHLFLPESLRSQAYDDRALPLGPQQSISQPYIVALMTDLAAPRPGDKVLEVGTGCGYQAAVLAEIAETVYTIEVDPILAERAKHSLEQLHYRNVHVRCGDGKEGWPEAAPFGAIVVTASTQTVPPALIGQLAVGGRLIFPHGDSRDTQILQVVTKEEEGRLATRDVIPVRFVPLE